MLDHDLETAADDFEEFVERIMGSRRLAVYRHDVAKLLDLMRLTLKRPTQEKWYEDRYDRLSYHCDYMIVKMAMDKRSEINQGIPNWLYMLAGFYDQTIKKGDRLQAAALIRIGPKVEQFILRGYTRNSTLHDTLMPGRDASHEP